MNGSTSTTLHPIERMIIKVLSTRADTPMTLEELAKEASLSIDQVRRGVEWLKGKQLVDLKFRSKLRREDENFTNVEGTWK
jgi:DNA-binding transcriptional regulator GbsR (MarR family)